MSDEKLSTVKSEITKVLLLNNESIEERWKICVKVQSKSAKLRLDNGTPYFKVVLEDDSGQIDAFAFGSQNVHRFFDRFEEDKVYFISDGNLIKKSRNQAAKESENEVTNVNDYNCIEGKIETEKEGKIAGDEGKVQNENELKVGENEGKVDENEGNVHEYEGKVPEGESKVPEGEGKVPEGEGKVPEGESKDVEGESNVPESEGSVLDGESKVPGGESKEPEGEGNVPEGESKEPEDEGKECDIEGKVNENVVMLENENKQKVEENEVEIVEREDSEPKKDVVNLEEGKEDDRNGQDKVIDLEEEYFYEIHLESGTTVTCQNIDSKPRSSFTPITQLRHVNKTFVDVVGILTGVWKLEMKYTQYRSINITDENGCDVNVALWGKMASDFDVKSMRSVVSLKHVRVKKENGETELQSTPNTELDYKPTASEAVVLREILGIADNLTDEETDTNHCIRCQKRRGSYSSGVSHSNKRPRYNSGNSSGRAKSNRNSINNAMCRKRRNKQVQGRTGRKIYIRKRNSTRDYFKSDDSDSDPSDSVSEDIKEIRGRRRPVRHCQSLYSENRKKRRVPTSSSDSDDSDDFTSDDDTDVSKKKNGKKNGKRGQSGNKNRKDNKKSSQDSTRKDGASTSQGPVTVISIQTDDESEVDSLNAKPALTNKKEKKWKDSDSDATVSYLDGKKSGSKSGPVKKSGPMRRRKKPSSDEDFKGSDDDSSSDDSSSDDSDDSDYNDDVDDDKTDDDINKKANKKPDKKKAKVASSKKKTKEDVTEDDESDSDGESGDDKKKKSNTLKKNLRKHGPAQKKKQEGLDDEAEEKDVVKTSGVHETIRPSGRKIKTRPRRNIGKKKNDLSDTDDLTDDDKIDEASTSKKESNATGSTCKQRKNVKGLEDVGKAKSDGKEKSESIKELPRIRLILRKAKKKVSYSESDDKTTDESKASGRQKNGVSKKGPEEKNEIDSPDPKPATRRSLSKQRSNVSEEVDDKDLELDAPNSGQSDSRTRHSMRKRKSCDYDEGKNETIDDDDDNEKFKDSAAVTRRSRRSSRKKITFTDDENEEKTDESDHDKKLKRKSKTCSSPVKVKTNACDEEEVGNSLADEHNDLLDSDKKNIKTRSSGRKQKSLISDLNDEVNDEENFDDFDLIVETTSTKKNSEERENVDVEGNEVDTTNEKPKARRRPGRPKNCVSDDESKSNDISKKKDLIEESPQTHHSLRKRKSAVKNNDEDVINANDVDNEGYKTVSSSRKHNTRRTSSRQKTIVTDDDDNDFQDEPEPVKKKRKSIRSAKKRKTYVSDDENKNKEGKDCNETEKSNLSKNMPKLRVVIGKLQDDLSSYSCGSKNGTDEEESRQSPFKEKSCKVDIGNNDKPNDNIDDEGVNDDETEAGKRKSTRCRSAVKRRQIGSGDEAEGDEKRDSEDESSEDDESKSHSDQKKFKRIKPTDTSSQETVQSVDPNADFGFELENSGNESETNNSTLENKDMEELEGTLDRDYIEELREFQKDDNGTVQLLQHYIQWFAMKAGGENLDKEGFQETIEMKNKMDARLEIIMSFCQSPAWAANFRADIMMYPEYNDTMKHSDLAAGDTRHLGNCQVCDREDQPWSVVVKLEGEPYDRESYQMRVKEEGESSLDLPAVEYYMGCFCHHRTKLFHKMYHFGHVLYHKCKEMLKEYDNDDERINKVATDRSLFEEMYDKLKKFMKEAEEHYTEDGEQGNNKWTREYNW